MDRYSSPRRPKRCYVRQPRFPSQRTTSTTPTDKPTPTTPDTPDSPTPRLPGSPTTPAELTPFCVTTRTAPEDLSPRLGKHVIGQQQPNQRGKYRYNAPQLNSTPAAAASAASNSLRAPGWADRCATPSAAGRRHTSTAGLDFCAGFGLRGTEQTGRECWIHELSPRSFESRVSPGAAQQGNSFHCQRAGIPRPPTMATGVGEHGSLDHIQ